MSQTADFPSVTPRFLLPLLFPGQAQKEFFFNQAISALDSLTQISVEDSVSTEPTTPAEGSIYRVTASATGSWSTREDQLAMRIGGAWQFASPFAGMQIFDRSVGRYVFYSNGWNAPTEPVAITGGSTVDVEARTAIAELVEALRIAGIFSMPNV